MGVCILYVDDELDLEELITQKFRKEIRKGSLEFIFAHNGVEALTRLIEKPDINMILSDINMPVMDGLTLLLRLNELNNPILKTVIVSAYGDMENIRTAMNRGAFDFITKPINFEDLEITINKTLNQARFIEETLKSRDKLIALQSDLDIARKIQQSILPRVFPPFPERKEFDLYASMNAAKSVGGDLYDFFMINDDEIGIVIGDVCDKGVPAAIFMAVSRTLIRSSGLKGVTPNECMHHVNNLLCKESINGMFVTVFYAILNIRTGELRYSNAGHNPPYWIKKDGTVITIESPGQMVLGAFEEFPYISKSITIEPGDKVYLFTDGVTESMDINRKVFSEQRLVNLLSALNNATCKDVVEAVVADVELHASGAEQFDDITMLALDYFGNPQ